MKTTLIVMVDDIEPIKEQIQHKMKCSTKNNGQTFVGKMRGLQAEILHNQLLLQTNVVEKNNEKELKSNQITCFNSVAELFTNQTGINIEDQKITCLQVGITLVSPEKPTDLYDVIICRDEFITNDAAKNINFICNNINLHIITKEEKIGVRLKQNKSQEFNCTVGLYYPKKGESKSPLTVSDLKFSSTHKASNKLLKNQFKKIQNFLNSKL